MSHSTQALRAEPIGFSYHFHVFFHKSLYVIGHPAARNIICWPAPFSHSATIYPHPHAPRNWGAGGEAESGMPAGGGGEGILRCPIHSRRCLPGHGMSVT